MEDETKIVEENEVKEAEAKETEAKETQARDSSILKDTVEQGEAPENKRLIMLPKRLMQPMTAKKRISE